MDMAIEPISTHQIIDIIVNLLDARDPSTFCHSWRVAELSVLIARSMGLEPETVEQVHVAAHLHDIGKIGVPDRILNKPGRLTKEEMLQMQAHPRIGYNILSRLQIFGLIAPLVLHHHERFDGLGYPEGMAGEAIPLGSRIIAVADAFDAITSDRPYRRALTYDEGFGEVQLHAGNQFCPSVVKHFQEIRSLVPDSLKNLKINDVNHFAFVGHQDLMHSRKPT